MNEDDVEIDREALKNIFNKLTIKDLIIILLFLLIIGLVLYNGTMVDQCNAYYLPKLEDCMANSWQNIFN